MKTLTSKNKPGLIEYLGGLLVGYPSELESEGAEIQEQFSAIQRGEITNQEEIAEIRRRSQKSISFSIDFWLGE